MKSDRYNVEQIPAERIMVWGIVDHVEARVARFGSEEVATEALGHIMRDESFADKLIWVKMTFVTEDSDSEE